MREQDGKVKLTDAGAAAMRAWAKRQGPGVGADLAKAMGTNQMTPSRAMQEGAGKRGWLTLDQAGHLVAYAAGELTAEMLVGAERAAAIPVYPPRVRRVAAPVLAALAPGGAAGARGWAAAGAEVAAGMACTGTGASTADEQADALFAGALPAAARALADAAAGGDMRAALAIIEQTRGKARQREARTEREDPLEKDAFLEELQLVEERLRSERDGVVSDGGGI